MREKMPRLQDPYADAAGKFSSPKPESPVSEYKALSYLGEIREKGFASADDRPPSLPQISGLPFPVARHRSHGPHWAPISSTSIRSEPDEAEDENDEAEVDGRASAQALQKRKRTGGLDFGKWKELLAKPPPSRAPSVEEEIDAENRSKVLSMNPEEIADAQRELLERLGSEKLSMLRRRGADKEKKLRAQASETETNSAAAERSKTGEAMEIDGETSSSFHASAGELEEVMEVDEGRMEIDSEGGRNDSQRETSTRTKKPESKPASSTGSDEWIERVEAVKLLRFNLAGFVTGKDEADEPAGVPGVSERDILRTEGDPAAFGYTIKEAAALSRSTIPGQRVAGLQLLAALLQNALNGLAKHEEDGDQTDWQAVWAYALGPQPGLVLTLRLALDDTYLTALIICVKALYALLSCSENENYFNLAESLWPGEPLLYTAPVFRQRKTLVDGFLGGGNWKYNIKSSELLAKPAPADNDEEDTTVGADTNAASTDVAGGLLRMGILPRIRYILEVEKLRSAEEPLLSIIVCLARHSPAAAEAVMECPRLMDIVARGFLLENDCLETTRAKCIELLKVLSQASKVYCIRFANSGALQAASSELFKMSSSAAEGRLHQGSMIEALRLWRVCMHHNVGISMFSDFYPALSFRLLPSGGASSEARECYNVLEILARKLPALNAEDQRETEAGWSWSIAAPIVSSSLEWLQQVPDAGTAKVEILGPVLHFLATICERVLAKDFSRHPWLPEFVPEIGLALVRSKLFRFHHGGGETLVSAFLKLRSSAMAEKLLPLVSCLRGGIRLASAVDKLLSRARRSSSGARGDSEAEMILHSGLVSSGKPELRQLVVIVEEIEKASGMLEEFNGRGGPAPGIGLGWGAPRGGFWSPELLLARSYAGILLELDDVLCPGLGIKLSLCRLWFEPEMIRRILSEHIFSREQWDSTLEKALDRVKKTSYRSSELEDLREVLIQHYSEQWLQRKVKKQEQDSSKLSTIPEEEPEEESEEHPVMIEWNSMKLPLPAHWILSALHSAMKPGDGDDDLRGASRRSLAGLLLLLGAEVDSPGLITSSKSRRVHALSTVFAGGELLLDEAIGGEVLRELQDGIDREQKSSPELDFERDVDSNYAQFSGMLAQSFTSSSFGDLSFGRQLAFYLRPRVASPIQTSVWRVLDEAKMLGLLPAMEDCPGPASAYLDPPQRNVDVLEMYVSAWTSGGLDKAFARGALPYQLALHHVRRFVFEEQDAGLVHHRKKLIRSIIKSIKRSPASQEMLKELLRLGRAEDKVFIEEACAGDSSLDEWRKFLAAA